MKTPTARVWLSTFGAMLFVTLLAACNFSVSTANLSSLKIGKDKTITTEAATFAPKDDVYAVAVVSNSGSKTTVKFQLIAEKVEGQADNFQIPGLAMSVDLPSSGSANFHLSAPDSGWPLGKYRIEAMMLNENGEQKDMKSATFTVADS